MKILTNKITKVESEREKISYFINFFLAYITISLFPFNFVEPDNVDMIFL